MVKKCIVEYDQLGNPIRLIELKEFTDSAKFKEFKELCDKNRKLSEKREEEALEKLKKAKKILDYRIEQLEKKAEVCICGIAHILGLVEYEHLEEKLNYFLHNGESEEDEHE